MQDVVLFLTILFLFSVQTVNNAQASDSAIIPVCSQELLNTMAATTKNDTSTLRSTIDSTTMNLIQLGNVFTLDASSQVKGDAHKLLLRTLDYEFYPTYNIPGLLETKIVDSSKNGQLMVWFNTRLHFIVNHDAKYFIKVNFCQTTFNGFIVSWELSPKPAGDSHVANNLVKKIEGTWYLEQLGSNETFVRYHLVLEPSNFGALAARSIQSSIKEYYSGLIRALSLGLDQ